MTVGELREQLKRLPKDVKVILSVDYNGTTFLPLDEVEILSARVDGTKRPILVKDEYNPDTDTKTLVMWPHKDR